MMRLAAKLASPAAIMFCAAVVAAPTAHADADSAYLDALSKHGITWSSDATVIKIGHAVCTDWAAGNSFQQTVSDVRNAEPHLSDENVGYLIGAATGAYCPQFESRLPLNRG